MHPTMQAGNVAVVTGGASGIGFEAARRLLALGLKVAVLDRAGAKLDTACAALSAATNGVVLPVAADVADEVALIRAEARVAKALGPVDILLNNAGMQPGSSIFDDSRSWQRIIDVNLMGIVRCAQVFAPAMIARGAPGLIVNTGSKQGITTPPGDPAYNVSKAGVKAFTEALQHELRNTDGCRTEARLFIPGFVFTPLTYHGRTEKPAGAWTPEEVVDFLFGALGREDFYILCPDNEVDRATDNKRIAWAAGDITENRPPLSRWHPEWGAAFARWRNS